jgi:hypothetical protein
VFCELCIAGAATTHTRMLDVSTLTSKAAATPPPAVSTAVFGTILRSPGFGVVGRVAVKNYSHGFLLVVTLPDPEDSGLFAMSMRGTKKQDCRTGVQRGRRSAHQHFRLQRPVPESWPGSRCGGGINQMVAALCGALHADALIVGRTGDVLG